jgi:DNA-binding response OmpR family regulator
MNDDSAVLIIDDDDVTRDAHAQLLRRAGNTVIERTDANDLLALVLKERPRLVLLDISLQGVNGLTACAQLRADARCSGTRILIVTAHDSFEAVRQATEAGADGFLCKPVPAAKLLAATAKRSAPPKPRPTLFSQLRRLVGAAA